MVSRKQRSTKTPKNHEVKSFPIFITKVDEATGIVEAVVSVFGIIDFGKDIIHAGAFTKTITERFGMIRVVDQHQTDSIFRVLGKPLAIREIGRDELPNEVKEKFLNATGGLLTETQYDIDTPEGLGAFTRIKSGSIKEYSIGYEAIDTDRSVVEFNGQKVNVRNIRQIKLWEYSPVIWGMNPATTTMGAKAAELKMNPAFGDYLHGELLRVANCIIVDRYQYGMMVEADYNRMAEIITAQLSALRSAIPEDIASQPLWGGFSDEVIIDYDENNPDAAGKAGRVISRVNADRLRSAWASLADVLTAAGILEEDDIEEEDTTEEESDDDAKSTQTPAGPVEKPSTGNEEKIRALKARANALTLGETL